MRQEIAIKLICQSNRNLDIAHFVDLLIWDMRRTHPRNAVRNAKTNRTLDSFVRGIPTSTEQAHSRTVPKMRVASTSGYEPAVPYNEAPFIYPKYPEFREYQYDIARQCITSNTLVCLPTGLGKTLVASVLMCNFYIWFPQGKIFFLAPTRPLVDQQVSCLSAYSHIVKASDIISIKGNFLARKRVEAYKSKRVFFCTPQTLENDLREQRLEAQNIVLMVFDEAHKATGNYSYVQVMRMLEKRQFGFRVIGLSATPGNVKESIQEVITNLLISQMVSKNEDDPEVSKYIKHKSLTPLIIANSAVIRDTEQVIDRMAYDPIKGLLRLGVIDPYLIRNGLCKSLIHLIRQSIGQKAGEIRDHPTRTFMYNTLKYLSFLAQAKDALKSAGYECFRKRFVYPFRPADSQAVVYKPNFGDAYNKKLTENPEFIRICDMFTNKAKREAHPKLEKLKQLLIEFFSDPQNVSKNSKAIVFAQYRENCYEILKYLQDASQIRATMFYGQSKTTVEDRDEDGQNSVTETLQMSQKEQQQVIQDFRAHRLNVLISTSIGEEGLDIGEVDCIFCYNGGMSTIRMVQRMGRTGRKRDGTVYIMLMEGKEANDYYNVNKKSKNIKKTVLREKFNYYAFNPTMLQAGEIPIHFFDRPPSTPQQGPSNDQWSPPKAAIRSKPTTSDGGNRTVSDGKDTPSDSGVDVGELTRQVSNTRSTLLSKYLESKSCMPSCTITHDEVSSLYEQMEEQTYKEETTSFSEFNSLGVVNPNEQQKQVEGDIDFDEISHSVQGGYCFWRNTSPTWPAAEHSCQFEPDKQIGLYSDLQTVHSGDSKHLATKTERKQSPEGEDDSLSSELALDLIQQMVHDSHQPDRSYS